MGARGVTRPWRAGIAVGGALIIGLAGYAAYIQVRPHLTSAGCRVESPQGTVPLSTDQAANSATIAAVAFRKRLPAEAVTIAYAAALQESRLRNLPGGDRDSVGLFQQRPSQGWGDVRRIMDPVYSANRFFDALVKVDRYRRLPLAEAAQRVQRSADGRAYARHEPMARLLTAAFTGQARGAVHCWYPPKDRRPGRRADAIRELRRAFGPVRVARTEEGDVVMASDRGHGWSVAAWTVSHAGEYGLERVRHDGLRWSIDDGTGGWTADRGARPDRVVLTER